MYFYPKINFNCLNSIKSNKQVFDICIDQDYCTIKVQNELIVFSYFRSLLKNNSRYYRIDFYSYSANGLSHLIKEHNDLARSISFSHALYIGQEIYKAELSIILLQLYIQQ